MTGVGKTRRGAGTGAGDCLVKLGTGRSRAIRNIVSLQQFLSFPFIRIWFKIIYDYLLLNHALSGGRTQDL